MNVSSSVLEISSRNQSLLAVYSPEIETAADKIIVESPSPAARRQALEWKAEAIPVMQVSLLNTNQVPRCLILGIHFPNEHLYGQTGPETREDCGDRRPAW